MNQSLHSILDEIKSGSSEWSIDRIVEHVANADPKPTGAEVWQFCSQLGGRAANKSGKKSASATKAVGVREGHKSSVWFNGAYTAECHPLPSIATDFAVDYLQQFKPKRLLDPWTEEPLSLATLMNELPAVEEAIGFTRDSQALRQFKIFHELCHKVLGWTKVPTWKEAEKNDGKHDPAYNLAHQGLLKREGEWEFDAMVCYPPLGGSIWGPELIVLGAFTRLSPHGVGLFVVPPTFFNELRRGGGYEDYNSQYELSIEAVLAIPPEYRRDLPKIDLSVIIIRKGEQGPLFVGELQTDPRRQKLLLENLEHKREVKDCALGMLVEREKFRGFQAERTTRDYVTLIERQALPLDHLSDVVEEINAFGRRGELDFPERPNAIYLPTIGLSAVVTSREEFQIKAQNYVQLVLKQEKVGSEYFAKFLNSDLGREARKTLLKGIFIPKISISAIREGVQIPLPDLSVQSTVIEAETRLQDLATDVDNLRKKLWDRPAQVAKIIKATNAVNREETFDEWLKTLPFPLASILWNYRTLEHEPKEQFELLLKFFEALGEMYSAILLSAARRDAELWMTVQEFLRGKREALHVEKSSFATWKEIAGYCMARFRELWNDAGRTSDENSRSGRQRCESALGTYKSEVIDTLLSKRVLTVLDNANTFRNDYDGHYGYLGAEAAKNLLVRLRSLLSDSRSAFGQAWENYQMILATDRSSYNGQRHETIVSILQGTSTPFLREKRVLKEPLKRDTLYLLDKDQDDPIELLPLVKISSAPHDAANACYFYNRKQPDGIRYVSYHFDKEADRMFSASEVEQLMGQLLGIEANK
jgi:hypothetical protein